MNIEQVPERYRKRLRVDEKACWLAIGYTGRYPRVKLCGKMIQLYRLIFELLVGPVPDGFHLHHKCGIKMCCNPDHLTPLNSFDHRQEHRQSHCKRGHLLDSENSRQYNGRRYCKICSSERTRIWAKENKKRHSQNVNEWIKHHRDKVNAYKREAYHRRKEIEHGV